MKPMMKSNKVIICKKSLSEASNDYKWQTDPELAHLTANLPLDAGFSAYLLSHIGQLDLQPTQHRFAIKTKDNKHIGNCACYNIDTYKNEAEIGIVIGDRHY